MHYGIIAAGEGSRLVQEGVARPKPLVELGGVPMIERLVRLFCSCRAESIAVIVNARMPEVYRHLERLQAELKVPLRIVVKSTPSSMHSFWELSRVLGRHGRFVLTTVDTVFRPDDFSAYIDAFEHAAGIDALMGVTPYIDDEKPLYVQTSGPEERITAFLDTAEPDVKYVSGGIYGLTPPCFDVLDRCVEAGMSRMRNFQRALVADGLRLRAFPFPKIIDVDHAADIAKAEALIRKKD